MKETPNCGDPTVTSGPVLLLSWGLESLPSCRGRGILCGTVRRHEPRRSPPLHLARRPRGQQSPRAPEAPVVGTEAQESSHLWEASRPRESSTGTCPIPLHSKGLLRLRGQMRSNRAAMMLARPYALASSRSGRPGLGCCRLQSEAEAEGLGQAELSCCLSLLEASLSFLSQCAPPSAPAPPGGGGRHC